MDKKSPFSVLIANYNNAKYIKKAIESVLKQTYKNWEIVIVDDASTDNSLEVIRPYLKDKRIKLVKHKENQGWETLEDAIEDCDALITNIPGIVLSIITRFYDLFFNIFDASKTN